MLRTIKDVNSIVFHCMAIIQNYQFQLQLLNQHTMAWPHNPGNMFCVLVRAFQLYMLCLKIPGK